MSIWEKYETCMNEEGKSTYWKSIKVQLSSSIDTVDIKMRKNSPFCELFSLSSSTWHIMDISKGTKILEVINFLGIEKVFKC